MIPYRQNRSEFSCVMQGLWPGEPGKIVFLNLNFENTAQWFARLSQPAAGGAYGVTAIQLPGGSALTAFQIKGIRHRFSAMVSDVC